jgi:hypothetical protein
MKTLLTFFVLAITIIAQAQNNDDVYYSPSQKPPVTQTESAVDETPAPVVYEEPPFYNYEEDASNTDAAADNNGISSQSKKGISTESYDDEYGNTYITNNYYGDSYEYDNYNYSNRLRRFYNPVPGFGYYNCYYDPFWVDPFWGYNSWYQPGININIGWGSPWNRGWGYGWNNWYNPYYGWGYNNWYGGGYYGGWGNPYWNGYNNGYWHGFNDGYYGNYYNGWNSGWPGNNHHSSNDTYYGPRRVGTSSTTGDRPSGNTSGPRVIKSEMPSNTNTKAADINKNRTVAPAPSNDIRKPAGTNAIDKNKVITQPSRNTTGNKNTNPANPAVKKPSNEVRPQVNPGTKGNIRIEENKNINNNRTAPAEPRKNSNNQIQRNNMNARPQQYEKNIQPKGNTPGGSKHYDIPKNNTPEMRSAPSGGSRPSSIQGGSNNQPRKIR